MNDAPAPRPLAAVVLTACAWSVMVLVTIVATPSQGSLFGLSLGLLLGFGGAGTLAARQVPAPAERRLGLVGFAPRLVAPLALLVPAVLLVSELDNWIALAFPGAKTAAESEASPSGLATLEWVLFGVLLRPVLEEFFFRGVVQQGAVSALGAARGVLVTALLFALVRVATFGSDAYHTASLAAQALSIGLLLGFVRLACGSILACVVLQMALEACGVLGMLWRDTLPIPGFNAGGAHTPLTWLAPAAAAVALGVTWLARAARPPTT